MSPNSQSSKTLGFVIMPEDLQRLLALGHPQEEANAAN